MLHEEEWFIQKEKIIKNQNYFNKEIINVTKQGIKLNIIGDLNPLSKDLRKTLIKSVELTKKNRKILVNLAINYGLIIPFPDTRYL